MNIDLEKATQANCFDPLGRYILVNFDQKRPFSSFLPGIAGLRGIPMWVFYVNRGQVVCSFGVENKDHPVMEFQAANKAYANTPLTGFRTFLNGSRKGKRWIQELFSPWRADDAQRTMFIGMNEVEIQEVNISLGYQVNILYFMLPNEPFSGLVRRVAVRNIQESPLKMEMLDGLPGIIPYGVDDGALKNIGRTIEAWMKVDNLDRQLPFYRLKATPGDTAEVHTIHAGNYALAFGEEGLLPAIADPTVVFGLDTSHQKAHHFHEGGLADVLNRPQTLEGRSLCALFGVSFTLEPGADRFFTSLYGYSPSLQTIQPRVESLRSLGYIEQKLSTARNLTVELTNAVRTESTSQTFDHYCRQTFLDNLLRGGYPLVLGDKNITHVYSRKHGDIERDYNYFVIAPEYYSQGNGNYRDINQNRRNDVFFVPQAGEFNIRLFMSLIQADGYNPLVINGLTFSIESEQQAAFLTMAREKDSLAIVLASLFTPGELFEAALEAQLSIPTEEFLSLVFSHAQAHIQADHGEGFWIDHWTYNLDLIEAYLAIYPERKEYLLFHAEPLPFYDSAYVVQPRAERYVCYHDEPRQLNAVVWDKEKAALMDARADDAAWARAGQGKGEIFCLPLVSKLVLLALIKFATRDPSGLGIQMEAGRPGWYDALNGLPGLFGSSMPETFELQRLLNFLLDILDETPRDVLLPIEAQILIEVIKVFKGGETFNFTIWEQVTDALEAYRESTRLGFDGSATLIDIKPVLVIMQESLEVSIARAQTFTKDIPPTYFIHEVIDYQLTGTRDANDHPHIDIEEFKPLPLPAFLEGPVRLMKIIDRQKALRLDQSIQESDLFDRVLYMYKVNAPLSDQSYGIGRARAFTPGWLENESVWMHMSFKYLLELLNVGLYDAFYDALVNHLPVFMDPDVYGRSPLENSSFIVSSAHPDSALHGNGFVARLSGSTAEFLSMWILMTVGKQPFQVIDGQLVLSFKPALPGWLFKPDGSFTFCFLGSCDVTLHNPSRMDTFATGAEIKNIDLHSKTETISILGAQIKSPHAEKVRLGEYDAIDLYF